VKWVWEMTLTAFLFQLALVLALRMGRVGDAAGDAHGSHEALSVSRGADGPSWGRWLGFGLVWGLLALSNPSSLLFLPVCGIWILARSGGQWVRQLPQAFCAGLLFLALIAPWTIRNQSVFHAFVPFRSNFGAELYLGNGPGADGFLMEYNHPNMSMVQYQLYAQMRSPIQRGEGGWPARSFAPTCPAFSAFASFAPNFTGLVYPTLQAIQSSMPDGC